MNDERDTTLYDDKTMLEIFITRKNAGTPDGHFLDGDRLIASCVLHLIERIAKLEQPGAEDAQPGQRLKLDHIEYQDIVYKRDYTGTFSAVGRVGSEAVKHCYEPVEDAPSECSHCRAAFKRPVVVCDITGCRSNFEVVCTRDKVELHNGCSQVERDAQEGG